MNHALTIARKDLLQMMRDWKSAFFLIVMPIVFTLMFGFAFGGAGGAEQSRLPVVFFAADDGLVGGALRAELADSALLALEGAVDVAAVEKGVDDGTFAAGLVVPVVEAGELATPTLTVLPGSSGSQAARTEIEAAVRRVHNAIDTAERATALRDQRLPFATDAERQEFFDETLAAARSAWADPPVEMTMTPVGAAEEQPVEAGNAYAHSSPAMMAQFAIAGLMGAAEIMVLERKSRALHRLLTTTVARGEILLGHFLAIFVLILAQLLLLMAFGQLILDLPYFAEPGAALLLALATAFFAASVGLLIGALARTEEQVIIFSLLPMFVLAALGGAWLPLELMPADFQRFAVWTPLARVVEGFKDILVRGLGVEAVLPATGVLAAYALLCLALVSLRFRTEGR